MPPQPEVWDGRQAIDDLVRPFFEDPGLGEMRTIVVGANRQPAVVVYKRGPGDDAYRPMAIDVLRIENGLVAEITTFGPDVLPAFELPAELR
jgi:RNA polymerase sigma-70 factor (ECF subfamily)